MTSELNPHRVLLLKPVVTHPDLVLNIIQRSKTVHNLGDEHKP